MSYFMSLSVWACRQRKGSHKTVKCFFSFPSTHFSFDRAFFARWAGRSGARRRLMERATWTNPMRNQAARMTRPSQIYGPQPFFSHSEAPLWSFWMYYSQSFTFCHLCLPLLPLPFLFHIPNSLFFFKCLSFIFVVPLFLNLGIFHRPFPFLPDILASCSLRQGVYNSPCKQSCSSGGMSHSLQRGALSQHLCVLSSQHPWPWQHNCMLSPKPPTHTTQGLSAGSSAAECVLDEHQNNVLCHTQAHNTLKIHFVFE